MSSASASISLTLAKLATGESECDKRKGDRMVDIKLHGKGNSKILWRKAGQPNYLVDAVDSDQ